MFFHDSGRISLAAVLGDYRIRIKDGYVQNISHHLPQPAILCSAHSRFPVAVHDHAARTEVNISLYLGEHGMVVESYDPLAPVPVGSKAVDDCTNDELLFALQYRLGLLHGELFKHV